MRSGELPSQTEPPSSTSADGIDQSSIASEHDIGELVHRIAKLMAENTRLTEEVSARDGFLAVAAHELKNALTPVAARVELLRFRLARWSPQEIEANLVQIEQATAVFARRATTLLDVSRMTSGKFQVDKTEVMVGPVASAICDSYRPLVDRARCDITLDLPDPNLAVVGDQLALEQILDNLVLNAIKYGAGTPIVVSAAKIDDRVRLSVSDKGPGISPEAQARIFERFERAVRPGEAGGFGVGLWVVKQLSEAMDGTVEVVSAPGAGSTFYIWLPVYSTKDFE